MSVTLTASYRDVLLPETVATIDKLVEDIFDLGSILEFIDERSEQDFINHYEEYVEAGETYGYAEVDAFLTLRELSELSSFEDCFIGAFDSIAEMAEVYLEDDVDRVHYAIVIDWYETARRLLESDVEQAGDFYFRSYF